MHLTLQSTNVNTTNRIRHRDYNLLSMALVVVITHVVDLVQVVAAIEVRLVVNPVETLGVHLVVNLVGTLAMPMNK